jgi:Flp pilus assembly pilin Flp
MLNAIKSCITRFAKRVRPGAQDGQALVEYSLIMALVGMALVATLAAVSGSIESVVQTILGAL